MGGLKIPNSSTVQPVGTSETVPATAAGQANRRILVIDDNPHIHADFRKVLVGVAENDGDATGRLDQLDALVNSFFGQSQSPAGALATKPRFELESVMRGQEGLATI